MGLMVPFLLGGMAFIGLPWLIHRIRRPAQKTTPFSSLMFVPTTTPPQRQRRTIEHPWLMALRMLLLVLLALAFARPYVLRPVEALRGDGQRQQHVVLVDTSLSMNSGDVFERARDAAHACVDGLPGDAEVAVISFSGAPQLRAPLVDPGDAEAGSRARARAAIVALSPELGPTRYLPALSLAEQLLRPPGQEIADEEAVARVIHLVSDFQRTGLPDDVQGYALARGVSLRLLPVARDSIDNQAVEAIAIEPDPPSALRARVRLRNYGDRRPQGVLQWWMNGTVAAEAPVTLAPESNTVVPMVAEADLGRAVFGEVRLLLDDVVTADNVHHFVYQPAQERSIGIMVNADSDGGPANSFLQAALATQQSLPWTLAPVSSDRVDVAMLPELVLVAGVRTLSDEVGTALAAYVERGGRILVIPAPSGVPAVVENGLLVPSGVRLSGPSRATVSADVFAPMNWIDFEHPVFQAFRSPAYSDFSMVRFYNHHRVVLDEGFAGQVIARIDAGTVAGDPAVLKFSRGAGQVALWAFPLDPEWTNITRTRRFVPMLHETISTLLPEVPPRREHHVGDAPSPPAALVDRAGELRVRMPGDPEPHPMSAAGGGTHLAQAGPLQWYGAGETTPELVEPVNFDPLESDLRPFRADEFLLRVGAVSQDTVQGVAVTPEISDNVVHWEYGYYVLVALAAAALLETGMALRYSRQATRERRA